MTDNDKNQAVEAAADPAVTPQAEKAKSKKSKVENKSDAKAKPKGSRLKVAKSAERPPDFDFIGKVERLLVKSGLGAEGLEFGLRGRHGKRRTFRLDPADAFALNAMAHLVLAAHASETKLGVRTGAEVEGVLMVRELESRPRKSRDG